MSNSQESAASYTQSLAVLGVEVPADQAEALADWIREQWQREPVELHKPGRDQAWLDVYFDHEVEAMLAARALAGHPAVRHAAVRLCAPRDWQSFWKHHFKTHAIGERLLIVPEWEREQVAASDRHKILIWPGLSFGTGNHFTTAFCLETLDTLCRDAAPASLLDVGTGSGILAIAAARLGVARIEAFDFDEVAICQAVENLKLNGVADRIRLWVGDILRDPLTARYDVVCANLFGLLLIEAAEKIVRAATRHVVLSGIREVEVDAVADAFLAQGAEEIIRDGDGEWCGLLLRVPTPCGTPGSALIR